jgi:hypothetical protein
MEAFKMQMKHSRFSPLLPKKGGKDLKARKEFIVKDALATSQRFRGRKFNSF